MHRRPRPLVPALLGALLLSACGDDDPTPPQGGGEARELGDGYGGEGAARPAHPPLDVPADAPRVAFLGDSITAGLHLAADEAWPAALQRQLFAEGVPFRLQNAGVSGDTTAGGLSRLGWILEHGDPDVVVVELGANDGLRGVDLANTEENLRRIVERVRAAGARALLVGMDVPTNLGEYARDFAALYPRVAEELDVAFVPRFLDGVGGVPELNLADGLHPTAEGHGRLAANVAPALRALLGSL